MTRLLRYTLLGLLLIFSLAVLSIYGLTWRPQPREAVPVSCSANAAPLVPGQALKVMTWNVQFLAGKRYVFWNDLAQGDDESPTLEDMAFSLDEVARVIRDEQPDVVLLQELDKGAKASDYQDQFKLLQERLADLYPCGTSAFDWKADFIPNPHIFGSVGRQLATLSRYRIEHAERVQLPVADANFISRQFQPKNALLVSYLPLSDGGQLAVLNTHLERATEPEETPSRQITAVAKTLDKFESTGTPWLIGGDFNQLPLGQYRRLPSEQRTPYSADSPLHLLWDKYPMIPTNNEASGIDREHFIHRPKLPIHPRQHRSLQHQHRHPSLPRHLQFRLSSRAAAVLADQHIDPPPFEQFTLALDVKRPTGTDHFAAFITGVNVQGTQGPELFGRDFVQVLQRLTAEGEEGAVEGLQGLDQFAPVSHFAPVIAGLGLPGRTTQGPAGNGAGSGCLGGVVADLGGVGVGGVQQQVDAFGANELRQAFGAAVAADAHLAGQVGGDTANAGQAVDMLGPEGTGDGQGFGDAAQ